MKTPAMKEALRQVRTLEVLAKDKYLSEMASYDRQRAPNEKFDGRKPVRKRRLTNDSTIEKLGELLNENPDGLIVFRDELYGFLMAMEKPGRENDRQFYLEAFNGDGMFTSDRIGRGTIDIPALCISLLGGIQPDRISSYFSETVKNGSGDDGFLSRFQVLVYPPRSTEWTLVDRYPNAEARDRAFAVFNRLDETDFVGHGFDKGPNDEVPIARFSSDAQELFYEWLKTLEKRLRSGEVESPAFEAHLTKYKKLMPSLALIFHVIDFCDPERRCDKEVSVQLPSAQMAAAWCDFLEAHAKKIYADALRPQITAAYALVKKIRSEDITDRMTVRGIYRKEWGQLRDVNLVRSGLSLLETYHWIKILEESPTGRGATSEVIYLNPELGRGGCK